MINYLITAFLLGIIGGFIPGPVLTATFTEILQSSFFKSFRIIFISILAETLLALTCLLVLTSLNFSEEVFRGVSFIGAGILIWIATSIWKIKKIDTDKKVHFSSWKIFGMIWANGVLWTYWITICMPKAIFLSKQIILGDYLFLSLVQVGWLIATIFLAFIFSRFKYLLSKPKVVPIIFKIFAFVFLYFAMNMIYTSIVFFIEK